MAAPLVLFLSAAPLRILIAIPALFVNWNKALDHGGAGAGILILALSWTIVGIYAAVGVRYVLRPTSSTAP